MLSGFAFRLRNAYPPGVEHVTTISKYMLIGSTVNSAARDSFLCFRTYPNRVNDGNAVHADPNMPYPYHPTPYKDFHMPSLPIESAFISQYNTLVVNVVQVKQQNGRERNFPDRPRGSLLLENTPLCHHIFGTPLLEHISLLRLSPCTS